MIGRQRHRSAWDNLATLFLPPASFTMHALAGEPFLTGMEWETDELFRSA